MTSSTRTPPEPQRLYHLLAQKDGRTLELEDIVGFELVGDVWFMYHIDNIVTAVPLNNWDVVDVSPQEEVDDVREQEAPGPQGGAAAATE